MEEYTKKFSAFHLQVENVILKSIMEAGEKGFKSVTIEFGPENVGFRFQLNISPDILKKLIMEEIRKHETYLGKRIKRGLFKTKIGKLINADVNGSYNIMKKAIPNVFTNGIEGLGVNPLFLNIKR